jgi:very-short-patch-repair endonuclease
MPDYRAGDRRVHHKERARALRRQQTDAEHHLWQRLRAGQVGGYKFRRQHEFGAFILDFYCAAARLAVEVDGGQHLSAEGLIHDAQRTDFLRAGGIRVVRFTNTQVLTEIDAVLAAIVDEIVKNR